MIPIPENADLAPNEHIFNRLNRLAVCTGFGWAEGYPEIFTLPGLFLPEESIRSGLKAGFRGLQARGFFVLCDLFFALFVLISLFFLLAGFGPALLEGIFGEKRIG